MTPSARSALSIAAAVAFLAGCDGSPPIGAPGLMPQRPALATHAAHVTSWMLPEAKSEDLLYVGDTVVYFYVLSYPGAKYVGKVALPIGDAEGAFCSDSHGNVFIPTYAAGSPGSHIYEYAHGATTPKRTLVIDGFTALGCSADPFNGNLTVADFTGVSQSTASAIAVYRLAKGRPKLYADAAFAAFTSCSYDARGNLFADGTNDTAQFAELPKGGSTFRNISAHPNPDGGEVQWDGSHVAITIESRGRTGSPRYSIAQFVISGSTAILVGQTQLLTRMAYLHQTWIQGSRVISPPAGYIDRARVAMWPYPGGGKIVLSRRVPARYTYGVTVSLASSDVRPRR